MSPPSENKQRRKNDELKLSVEEEGGTCPNPALHQEPLEWIFKAILFMKAGLGMFVPKLCFTLYFTHGTELGIERQIKKIKQFEESEKPPGIQVAFLGDSPDGDNFTFPVPICQGHLQLNVEVDDKKCFCCFDPSKVLVSIEDIERKSRKCLHDGLLGLLAHAMRLHGPNLPAFIKFSLLCKIRSQIRIPTNFKVMITATDKKGKEILDNHSVDKVYPACFYDADDNVQKNPKATGNSLENHHDKICQLVQNWPSVVSWLVTNGRLDNIFLKSCEDGSLTAERKGEILRHLYQDDNIFALFIEALKTSGGNEELLNFLHQLEDQNSSL